MTDQISIDETAEDIAIAIDDQVAELPLRAKRLLLAALGGAAMVGDKVGSMVEGAIGPSFDRMVERGESFQRNNLGSISKPAQQSLDAATDAGRQASRMASSTASTVATETRKQMTVAGNSVLEALSKQVDALLETLEELRKNMPQVDEVKDTAAKK